MSLRQKELLRIRCFVLLIVLTGCPSNRSGTNTQIVQPYRGQELNVVVPKAFRLPSRWEVMVQEWSSQSGASARFIEYDTATEIPLESGAEAPSGGSLLLFPLNQLCNVDAKLTPLPMTHGEFDARDFFKGLRERALSRDKRLIASPVSVPLLVCYFRADLLKAANRKPPQTWDEYHDLIQSIDDWAPGLIAVEPLAPQFRATTFFARTLAYAKHPENYSVWFDIDTAKPTITSEGFVRALETAKKTWNKLDLGSSMFEPADCRRLLLSGKAAIGLSMEPQSADFSVNDAAKNSDRAEGIELGICRLPGSRTVYNRNSRKWDTVPDKGVNAPTLCGFGGLAMALVLPAHSKDDAAALNLLFSLSTSLFSQAFADLPKGPTKESQLPEAPHWFAPDLSTVEASQYCDAVAQSLRDPQVVFELPVAGADDFRHAAADALEPLLRGQQDEEQTLKAMQASFEAIVQKQGIETIRASYRRGLGMPPALKTSGP